MDEITRVRELRDDAPLPDHARLLRGRRRLTEELERPSRSRRLRADWRFTAVAAAAAVAAAVLVGTQLTGDATDRPTRPGASKVQRMPDLSNAPALLRDAADAAAAQPDPAPENGQWVYQQTLSGNVSGPDPKPERNESWLRYDDPEFEDWKEGDDHSHRERYTFLDKLPEDADGVFEKARTFYPHDDEAAEKEPEEVHNYRAASVLLGTYPAPPEGLARVYRALAELDGMAVVDHLVQDARGRPAVAVYQDVEQPYGMRDEILLDPHSLAYAGERSVAVRDSDKSGVMPPMKEGDVLLNNLVLRSALVDEEGERPSGAKPVDNDKPREGYRLEPSGRAGMESPKTFELGTPDQPVRPGESGGPAPSNGSTATAEPQRSGGH